jgi:hypothetical protein
LELEGLYSKLKVKILNVKPILKFWNCYWLKTKTPVSIRQGSRTI